MKDPNSDEKNEQLNATEHSPPTPIPKFNHSYACECKYLVVDLTVFTVIDSWYVEKVTDAVSVADVLLNAPAANIIDQSSE